MDPDLAARLDQHVARLSERDPGVVWTRSSALRELLLRALAMAERDDEPDGTPS